MGDRHESDVWKEDRDAARWEAEQAAKKRREDLALERRDRLWEMPVEAPVVSHWDREREQREQRR